MYGAERNFQHKYYGWKLDDATYTLDLFMMLVLGLCFRALTYLALVHLNKAKQL